MSDSAPAFWHPVSLLATWFGSGLLPGAPGPWGSLAALPFAWLLVQLGGAPLLAAATILLFVIGIPVSARYAQQLGDADPGAVVIDEVAGQWLAILPVAHALPFYLVAFAAFRLFDIVKPWPVGWLDRHLKGGLGIMADDLAAGVYAAAVAYAALLLLG